MTPYSALIAAALALCVAAGAMFVVGGYLMAGVYIVVALGLARASDFFRPRM